jgi:GT2 family glycosyltransferase
MKLSDEKQKRDQGSSRPIAMNSPRVAIIIVNWNGKDDTLACLYSLTFLEDPDICVIVCDNGSSDRSIEAMQQWGQHTSRGQREWARVVTPEAVTTLDRFLTIIDIGYNAGFAGANNVGMRLALRQPSIDAVWLLNSDTEVQMDSLSALRRRMAEDRRIGICGSTLIFHHDKKTVQAVGVDYRLRLGYGHQIGEGLNRETLPTRTAVEESLTYVPAASMLVSREFIGVVGPMEESYFLYAEELDWSLRNANRFKMAWAPDSIVFHKEGASIGTRSGGRASELSIYYQNVNILRVVRQFAPLYLPMTLFRVTARAIRFLCRSDRNAFHAVQLAVLDFLRGQRRTGGEWFLPRKA